MQNPSGDRNQVCDVSLTYAWNDQKTENATVVRGSNSVSDFGVFSLRRGQASCQLAGNETRGVTLGE